jgi:3-oxoacyl-[acyl-carrier-protein] synthase II
MSTKIYITGIGMVSSAGSGVAAVWKAIEDGTSNPGSIGDWTAHRVEDASLENIQDSRQVRRMSRVSQLSFSAAREALRDAKLEISTDTPNDHYGIVYGGTHLATAYGRDFAEGFLREEKPMPGPIYFSNGCLNAVSSHISLEYRMTGCNHTVIGGNNVGLHAIGVAARTLREGPCRVILCAASEELTDILVGAYAKFRLLPKMTPAEGGAAILLETEESVHERCVTPYAELLNFHTAHGADIKQDIEGRGIAKSIEAVAGGTPIEAYASCSNGTDLDAVEANGTKNLVPETAKHIHIKPVLGEGFSFSSMAQAVLLADDAKTNKRNLSVTCSYDRMGDVSALSMRSAS